MATNAYTQRLASLISGLEGISNEDKSELLQLLNERKKYGLVWENHPEDLEDELKTKLPILVEDCEKFIDSEDNSAPNHIIIEGDNLHVLNDLCYTHEGKIDVIYIDPPYNTGNKDFKYNDSFVDLEDEYRHSKWLSFISKRLKIAKRLLNDNGVIFISIDDNEQVNLKLLCDEIFSSLDFIATIPWRKRTAKTDVPHGISQDYEWVLCYAGKEFDAAIKKDSRKYYETEDLPGRPWRVHDLTKQTTADERPNSFFTIVNPKNGKEYPANKNATWRITKETFPDYLSQNRIVFPGDYPFLRISKPVLRYFKDDDEKKDGDRFGLTAVSTLLPNEVGMTQDGTKDLDNIFGERAFGFPKPVGLIKYLVSISTYNKANATILDFFAGSGTSMQAVMQLNSEDGGKRQCILVTNNENHICEEVTYIRNKRVIDGFTNSKGEFIEGLHSNRLRYFKTEFKERNLSHQNKKEIVYSLTDILRIKENCYTEQHSFGNLDLSGKEKLLRYFEDGDKKMLILYDSRVIGHVVKQIADMAIGDNTITVYIFTDGACPYTEDFSKVLKKISLISLPHAMLYALRNILPEQKEQTLDNNQTIEEDEE